MLAAVRETRDETATHRLDYPRARDPRRWRSPRWSCRLPSRAYGASDRLGAWSSSRPAVLLMGDSGSSSTAWSSRSSSSRCFETAPTSAPARPRSASSAPTGALIFFQPQYLQTALATRPPMTRAPDPARDRADGRDLALRGRLIARFGARALMTSGMLCGAAGLVFLTQITNDSGYGLVLPGYLLFGVALGSCTRRCRPRRWPRCRVRRAGSPRACWR